MDQSFIYHILQTNYYEYTVPVKLIISSFLLDIKLPKKSGSGIKMKPMQSKGIL